MRVCVWRWEAGRRSRDDRWKQTPGRGNAYLQPSAPSQAAEPEGALDSSGQK